MSSSQGKSVQLGFAEEQDSWLLANRFFPSKIGGKPAWLELQNIPEGKDILCDYCCEPCVYLCQVYAGSENNAVIGFHRTIFVFVCRNGKCCLLNQSGNVKVLRSQLRLHNSFYPDKPSDESVKCEEIKSPVKLCRACGVRGPLVCGKCKTVSYCGQLHQKLDWKVHKQSCGSTKDDVECQLNEVLFPEFEIIIEQEENELDTNKQESEKEAEKRRLKEYEEMVKNGQAGEISDADLNEFDETKEDKAFVKFKKAIESYETQVLRYCRSGSPLWISDNAILDSSNVPKCCNCNGRRTFEFQIMPQMLNELKNYELDWGVIAVYTCEKDCDVNGNYVSEFCYKQDIMKGEDDDTDINVEKLTLNSEVKKAQSVEEKPEPTSKPKKEVKAPSKKSKPAVISKKAFEENDDEWE